MECCGDRSGICNEGSGGRCRSFHPAFARGQGKLQSPGSLQSGCSPVRTSGAHCGDRHRGQGGSCQGRDGCNEAWNDAAGVIVLSCGTYGNVLRFLPPLTISDELLEEGLDVLALVLADL